MLPVLIPYTFVAYAAIAFHFGLWSYRDDILIHNYPDAGVKQSALSGALWPLIVLGAAFGLILERSRK